MNKANGLRFCFTFSGESLKMRANGLPTLASTYKCIDCLFEISKIATCFLWLSLPRHYSVTDEALLVETK